VLGEFKAFQVDWLWRIHLEAPAAVEQDPAAPTTPKDSASARLEIKTMIC
jgi:hypothetical protein